MKAEAMLMHRERYVIAVRAPQGDAATVIQVSFSFLVSDNATPSDLILTRLTFTIGPGLERSPEARDDDREREGCLLALDQRDQAGARRHCQRVPSRHHAGPERPARQDL